MNKRLIGPKLTNYVPKLSLSGSETDVSTSNENLSPEERQLLRTTIRQEPQGEETLLAHSPAADKSTNNTLIIHHNKSIENGNYSVSPFFYGNYSMKDNGINNNNQENGSNTNNKKISNSNNSTHNSTHNNTHNKTHNLANQLSSMQINPNNNNHTHNLANQLSSMQINCVPIQHLGQSQTILIGNPAFSNLQLNCSRTSSSESVLTSQNAFNKVYFQLAASNNINNINNINNSNANNNSVIDNYTELQKPMLENYLNSLSNCNTTNNRNHLSDSVSVTHTQSQVQHSHDFSDNQSQIHHSSDFSDNQSQIHHSSDFSHQLQHLPLSQAQSLSLSQSLSQPPPEYERWSNQSPNSVLTSVSTSASNSGSNSASNSTTPESKSVERLSLSRSHPDLTKFEDDSLQNTKAVELFLSGNGDAKKIIDLLSAENAGLKSELDMYYKKVSKLQKFELEIQKVHQAHEELMRSSEKKEKLERAVRYKLEIDLKRLHEQNRILKEQLDSTIAHVSKRPISDILDDRELSKEIGKREVLIAQLLSQNKELLNEKLRLLNKE